MTQGVIYYNVGKSCTVRLLVSIYSLMKHYNGPITILSDGEESHLYCERIAKHVGIDFKKVTFNIKQQHNYPYLAKTRINEVTPYDYSVFLDADTLVTGRIDELFNSYPFTITRMAEWETKGPLMSKRIKSWRPYASRLVRPALRYGKAVNTGVYAFEKNAPIFNEWFTLTSKNSTSFIPDEIACQLLITKYEHLMLDCRFNYSCKFGPPIDDIRIIHYHGRKHCRVGLPFNADKWINVYNEVMAKNIADITSWQPAGDRMLYRYLKSIK